MLKKRISTQISSGPFQIALLPFLLSTYSYTSHGPHSNIGAGAEGQCDQIWRNFTTLARNYNTLAFSKRFIFCLATFGTYFDIFYMVLGKYLVLKMAKY